MSRQHHKNNPLDRLAKRAQISAVRDRLEVAPITVNGYRMDCHRDADDRLKETIETWDDVLGPAGTLDWTMADDTEVTFDKAGLTALRHAMRVARAARAGALHIKARAFKADPATTVRDIAPENWL